MKKKEKKKFGQLRKKTTIKVRTKANESRKRNKKENHIGNQSNK